MAHQPFSHIGLEVGSEAFATIWVIAALLLVLDLDVAKSARHRGLAAITQTSPRSSCHPPAPKAYTNISPSAAHYAHKFHPHSQLCTVVHLYLKKHISLESAL